MNFQSKLLDAPEFVRLFGTTAPRVGASASDIERAAARLLERISPLRTGGLVDGLVVYDVQDESERTSVPRPFPFSPTIDPRIYAQVLEARSGLPAIAYKCVGLTSESTWETWLQESTECYGVRCLSLVGRSSSRFSRDAGNWLSLARATQMAREHGLALGGVAIAERHSEARSESRKMMQKTQDGCRFFISQAIYQPEATIRLLRDYHADCREAGLAPQRIVLTFTPCGSTKTLAFLRWLGVAMDEATEHAILSAPNPLAASIAVCTSALSRIMGQECCKYLPLGINVESVSTRKEEADASVKLFEALENVMQQQRFVRDCVAHNRG